MIEEFHGSTLTTFHGLPVFSFGFGDRDTAVPGDAPPDVESWAWWVGVEHYDGPDGSDVFALFLETVDTTRIKALILGPWSGEVSGEDVDEYLRALLAVADRFPALEALFVSDIPQDMSEISWIEQQDPAEVLAAFPRLRVLGLRGALGEKIEPLAHEALEELVLQSGGLPPGVVRAVGASRLPALVSLDLYLGTPDYQGGATPEDLGPILSGTPFPRLRHLGLRDAANADDVAAALAHAPITGQLESLTLSLGTLGDEGVSALLGGQPLTHLARLDLHHNFLTAEMADRLWELLPEVEIDTGERLEPASWAGQSGRYVAISE